jgi:hypothetical protein
MHAPEILLPTSLYFGRRGGQRRGCACFICTMPQSAPSCLCIKSNQIRINQKSRELPCRLMMRYPRNRTTITTHTCACQETKTASSPLVLEDTRGPFTCTQQGHHSYHDLLSSINRMHHFEQREHHQSLTSCLLTTSVCTNIDG